MPGRLSRGVPGGAGWLSAAVQVALQAVRIAGEGQRTQSTGQLPTDYASLLIASRFVNGQISSLKILERSNIELSRYRVSCYACTIPAPYKTRHVIHYWDDGNSALPCKGKKR